MSHEDVEQQRVQYTTLLQSLGQASYAEIERAQAEREAVEPEPELSPEVLDRLQERLKTERSSAQSTTAS